MHKKSHIIATLACLGSAASAASADYYLQIKGVAAEGGYTLLDVVSTGDLDGDGLPDEAVVRLQCTGAALQGAEYSVKSPRDAASGQASGKRMHKPVTFVKEWGATTPQLAKVRPGYNVKDNKGARVAPAGDGWTAISLSDAPTLCADATAALKVTKSRSNIQNN
jgi:hypothetical protein